MNHRAIVSRCLRPFRLAVGILLNYDESSTMS
jgi:hypothetical protein